MSKYYSMSLSRLRDELDILEERLEDYTAENPDDYYGQRELQNIISNVCNLVFRIESGKRAAVMGM